MKQWHLISVSILITSAAAAAAGSYQSYSCYDNVEMLMLLDRDGWLRYPLYSQYPHRGTDVMVSPGETYKIELNNPTAWRVAVRLTVDGVNVLGPGDHKWVVPAGQTLTVVGWQRDNAVAAEFKVDDRRHSQADYLRKLGFPVDPAQMGIIEATFFREATAPDCGERIITKEMTGNDENRPQTMKSDEAGKAAPYVSPRQQAGTGAGETVYSSVKRVSMTIGEMVKKIRIRYRYADEWPASAPSKSNEDIGWGDAIER